MKKTIFAVVFFFITVVFVKAQTTQEEYNYVTKGYKTQVESGLDMKKGYSLKSLATETIGIRTVKLEGLYRTNTNTLCAIMIAYTKSGGITEYLCAPMPATSDSIYNQYIKSLHDNTSNTNSSEKLQLITYALTKICF